jgi:trimethylamine---corrinoid protein Co-methyltransferase
VMQHCTGLAMAGCNIIHVAIGNLEMMRLASFEACVIADEVLKAVKRFLQGIDTSRDAIGLDAFRESGHSSRFLETIHAARYSRSDERWNPRLTDRNNWETWMEKTGGKDIRARANDEARRILSVHKPTYVSEAQAREIDLIAREAQRWFIAEGSVAHAKG